MTALNINMGKKPVRVAIVPCNGEELCEGTVTRFATRKVLEELRPGQTVTMCMPLFTVGDEKQRTFTHRIATVTLDGCDKKCCTTSAAQQQGRPIHPLVVSEILARQGAKLSGDPQHLSAADHKLVDLVAEEVAAKVDSIIAEIHQKEN
ncbi:MAG: putative zinc-binding protein [Syntrophomonadaceae bacterium]